MDTLKIATLNCNGISDFSKRKDIFDYLRQQDVSIYFLQETHLKDSEEMFIRTGWGYQVILAGNSSNAGGTAILFKNNFEFTINRVEKDPNGQFIFLDITFMDKNFTLVNLYAPSQGDDYSFFDNISTLLEDFSENQIIIAGDFNCVLDPILDRRNYLTVNSRPRTRAKIIELMNKYNLIDIFRSQNPDKRSYTWRKFNCNKQARLDYFIVSDDLSSEIRDVEIMSKYRSDHSEVILSIKKSDFKRDRTYWKFNNSLLYDSEYVKIVKDTINEVKKQYCSLVYDYNLINLVPNDELDLRIDDDIFMEMLLMQIRGKTIAYSSHKKKENTKREYELEKQIHELENNVDLNFQEIDTLKAELETLRENKIRGMAVRSKANWLYQGEKVSKYFLNLENRNYKEKLLTLVETADGNILTDQSKIKDEVRNFYKTLYSEREVTECSFDNIDNANKLQDEDKQQLEGKLTIDEIKYAVKGLSCNKSPGPDGYTAEFFKFFLLDLGTFILRAANFGLDKGEFSSTFRQGNIVLIPKDNKPKRFIKNLRPISLLSTMYKIVSTCIANRMKLILPNIIGDTQHAFLKSRNISSNIRFIYDTLIYTEENNIPGMLLSIDFEKAFDSISWSFLFRTLEFFNFGPIFIRWIRTFYSNIKSCISINGQYSDWFNIERGVRQGDPSSPYLYLVCAEILSLMIKSNDRIKGIQMRNNVNLLSQFADDTTLSLDGTEQSLKEAIDTITCFSQWSGLKINEDKTMIVWIGGSKGSNLRYFRDRNFVWEPGDSFKIVGIFFSTNKD